MPSRRVIVIVLDGVGVGELPDAGRYGDRGSHTLAHALQAAPEVSLPNLAALGLGNVVDLPRVARAPSPGAAHGMMAELSAGKDTTTGHWELFGLITDRPFPTYADGLPEEMLRAFADAIGREVLGGQPASGTAIIAELGEEHLRTGRPIVYTSADSVFQIACHEDVVPRALLYDWCAIARAMLQGEQAMARVIARPFVGAPGSFVRTDGRKDFALPPPAATQLDVCLAAGLEVHGVGKVRDIFAGRGFTDCRHTVSNSEGVHAIHGLLATEFAGVVFANLNDTDSLYGHRNDPRGFARALVEFDEALPSLLAALRSGDLLVITADHGCDPTSPSTDHTREYVPVLVIDAERRLSQPLGTRRTFADVAATISAHLGVDQVGPGAPLVTL